MAPALASSTSHSSAALSTATSSGAYPPRTGPRTWEALPAIAYGFVIYPLTPAKPVRRQSRSTPLVNGAGSSGLAPNGLSTLREEPETELQFEDANEYSEQATLEIGDEVYAFEKLVPETRGAPVWYRG